MIRYCMKCGKTIEDNASCCGIKSFKMLIEVPAEYISTYNEKVGLVSDAYKNKKCQDKEVKKTENVQFQNDIRQSGAYKAVILECTLRIEQDDYATDSYISDLLKKYKVYSCGVSIDEIRKAVTEHLKSKDKKVMPVPVNSEKVKENRYKSSVENKNIAQVNTNKAVRYDKKISANDFKKSIDYKIVVSRAYFKELEEGSVSDAFILGELDKLNIHEKCMDEISIDDVKHDMWLLKKSRKVEKKEIADIAVLSQDVGKKNLSSNDIRKSENYNMIVKIAYLKKLTDGQVSDDFILDKLKAHYGDDAKKITVDDIRYDMHLIDMEKKKQKGTQTQPPNIKAKDSTNPENISQARYDEKSISHEKSDKKQKNKDNNTIIIVIESATIAIAAIVAYLMFYSSYVEPAELMFMPKWALVGLWFFFLLANPLAIDYMLLNKVFGLNVVYVCMQIMSFYIAELINGGPCSLLVLFLRIVVNFLLFIGSIVMTDHILKHREIKNNK